MMIPKIFLPNYTVNLIRIGKNNDGGYLVDKQSVLNSNILISFGINDDCSFELEFEYLNSNVKVFCYDGTIEKFFWTKKILIELVKVFTFRSNFNKSLTLLKKFLNFIKFFKKNIIINKNLSNINSNKLINLDEIFKNNNFLKEEVFIKLDIERDEYRILDDLIKYEKFLSGLVIEIHDFDVHLEKIILFVKKFNLILVHIHANNFGYIGKNGIPTVVELSFSKNINKINKSIIFPHNLDQPNNPDKQELALKFES
jgi:hypothetical protein